MTTGPLSALRKHGVLDLRSGDPRIDNPLNAQNWAANRTIRAKDLVDLLVDSRANGRRPLRLVGAHVTGTINLESAALTRPIALEHCRLEHVSIREAETVTFCLPGTHIGQL